jgi:hypothetical protein
MTPGYILDGAHRAVVAAQGFVAPQGVKAPFVALANKHGAFVGLVTK